ncbi:hypothetical protein BV372_20375 [Nostoc sp. T09]|uniref:hypothetical protein n=1 Tax=Nostoc sp. T09 TaxID=1932621 RepID=UPI000B6E984D|nr:hypothetical protein [Nostoc sp. T09]OUL31319.1 hypothetical protein BV372_20375 [Nostoc sp. T09]
MDFEGKATSTTATDNMELPSANTRKPLVLLRDTEALLRRPAVETLLPILPPKLSNKLQTASSLAEESLKELAEINLEEIGDFDLRPARIRVGLSFVGFGALMILILLLHLKTLNLQFSTVEQMQQFWYQYVWFVCLGVAGMFILGREAMRPIRKPRKLQRDNIYKQR